MGRLTEFFAYINAEPNDLSNVKFNCCHLTFDDNIKKLRKEYRGEAKRTAKELEEEFIKARGCR